MQLEWYANITTHLLLIAQSPKTPRQQGRRSSDTTLLGGHYGTIHDYSTRIIDSIQYSH